MLYFMIFFAFYEFSVMIYVFYIKKYIDLKTTEAKEG